MPTEGEAQEDYLNRMMGKTETCIGHLCRGFWWKGARRKDKISWIHGNRSLRALLVRDSGQPLSPAQTQTCLKKLQPHEALPTHILASRCSRSCWGYQTILHVLIAESDTSSRYYEDQGLDSSEYVNHTKSADKYRKKAQEEISNFSKTKADRLKEEGMIKYLKRKEQELENSISAFESQANTQRIEARLVILVTPRPPRHREASKSRKTEQNLVEEVSDVEETAREINELNFVSSARRKNEPTLGQIVCYGAGKYTWPSYQSS